MGWERLANDLGQHMQVKKVSIWLVIALLTFTVGVVTTLLWVVPHFRLAHAPNSPEVIETSKREKLSLPEGWRELEIKNSVTLQVPQDMQPAGLPGDALAYREAYKNQEIYVAIVYGEIFPRRNEHDRPNNACDTPPSLANDPAYQESFIDIEGRRAKFIIDEHLRPTPIVTSVCFPPDDSSVQLNVAAYCKDDHAVQIARQMFASIRFRGNK